MRSTKIKAVAFGLGVVGSTIPCIAFAFRAPSERSAYLPPLASAPVSAVFSSLQPVSNDDLSELRGGFSAGGISFNFGASIQTMVNGQLALQTNVQWTPTGAAVTQLQGLGTKIQSQVASKLADVGIGIPMTKSTAQMAGSPIAAQTASIVPATAAVLPGVKSTLDNASVGLPTISTSATSNTPAGLPTAQDLASAANAELLNRGGASATVTGSNDNMPALTQTSLDRTANAPVPPVPPGNPSGATVTVPVTFISVSPSSGNSIILPESLDAQSVASSSRASSESVTGSGAVTASLDTPTLLSGVQIQSPTGSTQVLANVTNGQIQNIIFNTASNQDIVQNTNIVLTIYNLSSWQQALAQHATAAQLADQMLAASGFAAGH